MEEPEEVLPDEEPSANWCIALNLALLRRFSEALSKFQAMAEDDPLNPALHYNIGLAHLEIGDSATAVESFRRAIELAPERADAFTNLGVSLQHLGRLDDACEAYRQAMQLRPNEPAYYYCWGTALLANNDPSAAVELLGDAYNADVNDPEYCFNFALCLARLDRQDDARQVFAGFLKLSRGRYPERETWAQDYISM